VTDGKNGIAWLLAQKKEEKKKNPQGAIWAKKHTVLSAYFPQRKNSRKGGGGVPKFGRIEDSKNTRGRGKIKKRRGPDN